MHTIFLSGSLAYDHIMDFPGLFKDHFLPDKLHNINVSFFISDHAQHFGGTAVNVAYSLAMLGEKPTLIATAGYDFDTYRLYLEKLGISTASIPVLKDKATSFAYVMTDEADNQISAFHPGAGGVAYAPKIEATPESVALISAGCLDDIRSLPDIYRGNGTKFLFDPGQSISALTADELRNGITDADAVFANDYEFSMITEKTQWREADVLKVAKVLVITLGKDGSRVITREGETRVAAVPTKESKDPTGAGDAYRAGYLKAFVAGKNPIECAKLGSCVAVYAVECVGTQEHTFTMDGLKQRYEQAYKEELKL